MNEVIEKQKVYKILGYTEHVQSCDCCGKHDLKGTIAMESIDGQISYFGTTCAGYMNKVTEKVIVQQLSQIEKDNLKNAKAELRASYENIEYNKALSYLDDNPPVPTVGKTIGMLRVEYLKPFAALLEAKKTELKTKYYLKYL